MSKEYMMLVSKIKTAALAFLALSSAVFAYDLKTKELVPVKFQKAPVHAPVKLIENGKLNFAIVADLTAERRMQKRNRTKKSIEPALQTLQEAFFKCTGIKPEVLDVKDAAKAKFMIVVGDNTITRANGINVNKLPQQGLVIKSFAKGIIIAGRDSSLVEGYNSKPLEGKGSSLGTKFAAYDFVERFLGVRYYYPGEYGTLWPKIKDLTITPVYYTDAPYMDTRGGQFYLASTINSKRGRDFWEQYLGKLSVHDAKFYEKWRMGSTLPNGGTHCPRPERIAKAYPDKLKTIFYTSPTGNFWYNPKAHIGNYFDVVNLEFADLLLNSAKKFYASNGKIDEGGYAVQGCNTTNFSFGVCDTLLPDTDVENHPIVKKYNLMNSDKGKVVGTGITTRSRGMANIYARFHQYLAQKMKKELPGIKLYILAYYNVQYAGTDPRFILPDNTEVYLCLGDIPNKIRSKTHRADMMRVIGEWYTSLGNRPVQGLWLYTGTNPFVMAVNGEFVGDIPKTFGKYFGKRTMFYDHCINATPGNAWFYYYSNYAAYRSMWNPYWDAAAAIDAHWEPFYGKETGKILKQFHQHLRYCYAKYALEAPGSARNVLYPLPELLKMEKLLAMAAKTVKPGTVEAKRFKLFAAPWKKAIESIKNQLSYERPVHGVYQLLRKDKVILDGQAKEKFWGKIKPLKLIDPKGTSSPMKYPASIKLAWNKTGVFGLVETKYPPVADKNKTVFANDNIEIFLSPGQGKEEFFQFVFDPLKQTFFGTQRLLPIPQPFDQYWKVPGFKVESNYGPTGWTAEFFIPFASMKIKNGAPNVYDIWHCNIVRNKMGNDREYRGTAMTLGDNRNMNMFGLIKFAGKGE